MTAYETVNRSVCRRQRPGRSQRPGRWSRSEIRSTSTIPRTRLLCSLAAAALWASVANAAIGGRALRSTSATPRDAVARIVVPEDKGATSYGTGTLIDVRDQHGLVVTNWHVVRDAAGLVEVVFPNGFRSHARPLKMDADWDLAALVIWRPPVKPVPIAKRAPQPNDVLTICGYGQGNYREATGRCTQYLAPRIDFPREMVELNVEARQGDSGGPIFNDQDELAGVLFGASRGTTLGSFGGRVERFLASLAPDIGNRADRRLARSKSPPIETPPRRAMQPEADSDWQPSANGDGVNTPIVATPPPEERPAVASIAATSREAISWRDVAGQDWFGQIKTLLALVGLGAVLMQIVRWAV